MKKRIIIPIVLFILCLFLSFISLNVYEEYILTEEISNVNDVISEDNVNSDKLVNLLDRNKTKYEYNKIEKTYKKIVKDRVNVVEKIDLFYDGEENIDYMSIASIRELDNTNERLNNSIEKIEQLKNEYEKVYSDRYVKNQLKKNTT